MTDLQMFLKGNAKLIENVKFPVSNRFLDTNGEAIKWELKAIDVKLDESIRKESTRQVPLQGKRGRYTTELDTDKYFGKLCAHSIVFPNLNDVELQDSYGVKDAESLLKEMLTSGEYTMLKEKVAEVNGYDVGLEDLVNEAKN